MQPCVFTEEEFDKEIELAEASGYITNEQTQTFFAQWGFTIQYEANKLIKIQDNFAVKIFDRKKQRTNQETPNKP